MAGNVEDVRSHQRFAAGNDEETSLVHFRDLIDEAEAFFGREFIIAARCFGSRIEVAMVALEITALRQIECDKVWLKVVDRPAVVWAVVLRAWA